MLTLHNISCHRGDRLLLQGCSLTLAGGQGLWLTGENGIGKSTLLRVMAGVQQPLQGSVRHAAAYHYLPSESGFDGGMTLHQNLRWWAGQFDAVYDSGILARAGLQQSGDVAFSQLSQGQKQRAALLRLLIAPRKLWLLDEPLAHLDAAGRQWTAHLLEDHLQHGGAFVAATHDVPFADNCQMLNLSTLTPREVA